METKYNIEKVAVTVHLTPEAAATLRAYAGERNRGRFLSDLIMEQRRRDDLEGQIVARQASQGPVEAPKKVQAANPHTGARNKRRKRR